MLSYLITLCFDHKNFLLVFRINNGSWTFTIPLRVIWLLEGARALKVQIRTALAKKPRRTPDPKPVVLAIIKRITVVKSMCENTMSQSKVFIYADGYCTCNNVPPTSLAM